MKKEIADKWVAALRSGKYVQGTESLRDNGKHCCLGVLAELYNSEHDDKCPIDILTVLDDDVAAWADTRIGGDGTHCKAGERGPNKFPLWRLNDGSSVFNGNVEHHTFAEIADIIEAEWETL